MDYKTLLALHPAEDAPERLAPIVALARAFGARIDARVLAPLSPIPTMAYLQDLDYLRSESFTGLLRETDEATEAVRAYLAEVDLVAEVAPEAHPLGMIDEAVARAALYADLAVLRASSSLVSGPMGHALEGALFAAGRPALVLGEGETPPIAPALAMIAWDGGREAARAVHAALPFLQAARTVRAFAVSNDEHDAAAGGLARLRGQLAAHGVTLVTERVEPDGRFVVHALAEHVVAARPDLLVMGAYGHARLRERLFSGVTRVALEELETPLLLAH